MRRTLGATVCAAVFGSGISTQAVAIEPGVPAIIAEPGSITQADVAAYAAIFWDYYETGVVPEGGEDYLPSDPESAGPNAQVFHEAQELFMDLYAQELNGNLDSEEYYTLDDLLRDNPAVLSQFMEYTLSGQLLTSFSGSSTSTI